MTFAVFVDNADPAMRYELESKLEPIGHEIRASLDERYKRSTWGTRPEDAEAIKGFMTDVSGDRS